MVENAAIEVVTTGAGGTPLRGTLVLPAARRPVPAVLLVQGSGPTDRDGNQPPVLVTNLFSQLATALAGFGIASLRYDKRGMHANAASLPRDETALRAFVRFEHFVDDAAAMLAALRARPEVDAGRVGLLGHSEGGLIGLALAARGGPGKPAMLVLAATPGRPLAALLREQLGRLGRRQGADDAVLAPLLADNDQILAHLQATGDYPPSIAPGLRALYQPYLRTFLRSLAALRPAELAAEVDVPVLVINGTADQQVSADDDALALGMALAGRAFEPNVYSVGILNAVSHTLKAVAGPADPGFAGPVADAVTQALHGWFSGLGWTSA